MVREILISDSISTFVSMSSDGICELLLRMSDSETCKANPHAC